MARMLAALDDASQPGQGNRPVILLGGVVDVGITSAYGGRLYLVALATPASDGAPIQRVELLVAGQPSGTFLLDDGAHNDLDAGDGLFGLAVDLPPGVPAGRYEIQLRAVDSQGRQSAIWPRLEVSN